ncbi:MAG: IPT/TIG domain-containing protein, partial [Gammaproteobacteria bacterium]|nr:IPT/TIG domain-containing protein [Gammaproteobacteria bacterium]
DTTGNVYVISGNAFDLGGYDGVHNFSQSVLKLNPAEGLRLIDWFTPSNWAALDYGDLDLTSSGPMLIPATSLLVGGGKTGVMYVLNINHLGKYTTNDSGAIQKLQISRLELRGGPVYWHRAAANGGPLMYDWSAGDRLKAFRFNGSTFGTSPSAQGGFTERWPGGILTLSANGSTAGSGVLWATVTTSGDAENNPPTPGELYAFDAANVARVLWRSDLDAARDSLGNFAKFVPPLVANGRVYVATWSNHVAVYGLLSTLPTLTAVSPRSGPDTGGTAVTLTGQNFTAGTTVSIGGVSMTRTVVVSATRINAVTPLHTPGTANVVITNPGGQNAKVVDGFTFLAAGSGTAAPQ